MEDEENYTRLRHRMVKNQIANRQIKDQRVLQAMREVPRHLFVDPEYRHLAYSDGPLPIGLNQTISQPYIVALMSELLELQGHEKVLEIGCGSGYQAAVLAHLAGEVHTIERHPALARHAARLLVDLGLANVHVHMGDGSLGLPEHTPYDGIIVTAGAPNAPRPLLGQLNPGGRLVIPVGGRSGQFLERWRRIAAQDDESSDFFSQFNQEMITPVAFVPLIGEHGWPE
jgi:protein-L-isoaspartate(D-aspartate) O-methyltransferase